MHGANAGTGQHHRCRLANHGQVDTNPVTFFNTLRFQDIGKLADILMQLPVSDLFIMSRIIAFPDNSNLVAACFKMTINAVDTDVKFSTFKPAYSSLLGNRNP